MMNSMFRVAVRQLSTTATRKSGEVPSGQIDTDKLFFLNLILTHKYRLKHRYFVVFHYLDNLFGLYYVTSIPIIILVH